MGRAERNPSRFRWDLMGIAEPVIGRAFARPGGATHPCMGLWKSRGRHGRELLLQQAFQFLCSTEGVSSSRPRCFGAPRAAAVKAGRHCAGAADGIVSRPRLDGGEPGAPVDGRDDRSRDRRRDVVLDWAVNDACGEHRITLYPVRDESPVPQSFMHG